MTDPDSIPDPRLDPGYGVRPSGYRLPPDTRLGPIRLQVADLDRSLEYYRDVLGLRLLDSSGATASLGAGEESESRVLVELRGRPGASPVRPRSRLGLFHFALLLPDRPSLGRFVSHMAARGVRAGASDHGVSEAIYLQDPDGLGIEVYADRPRSTWRRRDRELVMVTEPLDLRDLVATGGDEPWAGAPSGTTIGHVHLHVGDLERATDFYHEGLGLDRVVWGYPGALFLSAGGYHHHLGLNTWAAGAPSPGDDEARLLEWTVVLPSGAAVDGAAASLEAAGFGVGREPAEGGVVGEPGRRETAESAPGFIATDPWGTAVRAEVDR